VLLVEISVIKFNIIKYLNFRVYLLLMQAVESNLYHVSHDFLDPKTI
jgi:hypothetical protein